MATKRDLIMDILENSYEEQVVESWNYFSSIYHYDEDIIRDMYEFDTYCADWSPSDIVGNITSDFDYVCDNWFIDGAYGFESSPCADDFIRYDELIDWILDDNESGGIPEIDDLLDSEEYKNAD